MDGSRAAATLGVSRCANKDELRQAFRARAKRLHPDAGPNGSASAFIALRRAFDLLMAAAPDAPAVAPPATPAPTGVSVPGAGSFVGAEGARPSPTIDLTDVGPLARSRPAGSTLAEARPRRDARGLSFEDHLSAALARP